MIQIVEFKERYGRNDNAIHGANKWLEEHREYRIIDIKYQTITDEGGDRTSILIIYDNFTIPPAKALKECADQLQRGFNNENI